MRLEVESRVERVAAIFDDFPLVTWLLALVLGGVGVLFVHSATLEVGEFQGQATKQAVAIAILAAVAVPLSFASRRGFLALAGPLYVLVLLALVLVPFLGVTINGARRWFSVGGTTIQPTEFMKPVLVLMLARYLRFRSCAGFWQGVGVPLLLTLAPMWLMVRQPDLGSALSLLPVLFAMCYAGGARPRALIALAVLGLCCLVASYPLLHAYQKERILVWLQQSSMSPADRLGAGYHLWQSLIAVGSGGLTGSGLFEGVQNRYDFLPYRSTDFLFAVVAEETGFLGGSLLVGVYLTFCMVILGSAIRIRDRFGRLLVVGVAALFATHLFIHVGVCTGLLPPTGLPLPLLSYGRSSVAGAFLALALAGHALVARQRNLSGDMYL